MPAQVIKRLQLADVAMAEGSTVTEAGRKIGVTEQTLYGWPAEYGGLRIGRGRGLKQLKTENGHLRRAVADLTLDNQILNEAARRNSKHLPSLPIAKVRWRCAQSVNRSEPGATVSRYRLAMQYEAAQAAAQPSDRTSACSSTVNVAFACLSGG